MTCSKNSASVTKIVGGEAAGTATWGWAVSLSVGGNFFVVDRSYHNHGLSQQHIVSLAFRQV